MIKLRKMREITTQDLGIELVLFMQPPVRMSI